MPLDGGTSVQTGDTGSSVFMNIPTGNGTFTTAASSANTGTGVIDAGSVTNAVRSGCRTSTRSPSPTRPTSRSPTASGTVVASGTYDSANGGNIAFNGIEVGISGTPAAGDTFTVAPSGKQSVFDTLDNLVSALNSAGAASAARAQLSSELSDSLQQIDQALQSGLHVTTSVGARMR